MWPFRNKEEEEKKQKRDDLGTISIILSHIFHYVQEEDIEPQAVSFFQRLADIFNFDLDEARPDRTLTIPNHYDVAVSCWRAFRHLVMRKGQIDPDLIKRLLILYRDIVPSERRCFTSAGH